MIKFEVVPFTMKHFRPYREEVVGYHVTALYRPPMEDMWESLDHVAVFRTKERAEAFMAKVVKANRQAYPFLGLDFKNWKIPTSEASPIHRKIEEQPGYYSVI